jgi:hypothetical protein
MILTACVYRYDEFFFFTSLPVSRFSLSHARSQVYQGRMGRRS